MFQAVRKWWGSGRGKVSARLFLFEFVVVVAGILTAQMLTNWVAARAENRAIRAEHRRVRYEIGRSRQNARVWIAAVPCLEERLNHVIIAASSGGQLGRDDLQPPRFTGYTVEPLSLDMLRAFQGKFGVKLADDYNALSSASYAIVDNYRAAREAWDRFALMDPALGASTAQDRATVRDVAVQARSELRRLKSQAEVIEVTAGRLGIAPLLSEAEAGSAAPVRTCAEIWQTGRVWREAAAA